jgi:hypothetical protein
VGFFHPGMNERILIGLVTAALCGLGLWHDRWLFAETRKGRRLAAWLGEVRGLWALRALLFIGLAFGLLLAAGVIRPVEW